MSDQNTGKQTVPWADLIRVVAIYLVVIIHVSGQLSSCRKVLLENLL